MGMKGIFQAAADVAFSVAGDVKKAATYTQVIDDGLNAAEERIWDVELLFGEFSREDKKIDTSIMPGDVTTSVLFKQMKAEPVKGDTATMKIGGDVFVVINFSSDPAEATYDLHLRTM